MLEEFKKFALRGNAVDLAIGVIIGAAFGAIVNSLVGDVLTPIIGAITGGLDFSNHFVPLSSKVTADSLAEARKQGAVLAWGSFLTFVINFIIIALVLFIVVKLMNRVLQAEAERAPSLRKQETLLTEIRDLLKSERKWFAGSGRGGAMSRVGPLRRGEGAGTVFTPRHCKPYMRFSGAD